MIVLWMESYLKWDGVLMFCVVFGVRIMVMLDFIKMMVLWFFDCGKEG